MSPRFRSIDLVRRAIAAAIARGSKRPPRRRPPSPDESAPAPAPSGPRPTLPSDMAAAIDDDDPPR